MDDEFLDCCESAECHQNKCFALMSSFPENSLIFLLQFQDKLINFKTVKKQLLW